jgi:CheY-like chemotaxis protein
MCAPARPLTVLIADDTPANQRILRSVLNRAGHAVVIAADGREALDALDRHDFDVVVLDFNMPVLNGLEIRCAIPFDGISHARRH